MSFDLILKNVAKHIRLTSTEEDFFISLLQLKIFKRKDFMLKEGEICKTENFVLEGCVRAYTIDENGSEYIIMFAPEDWWFGDLYSFLTQSPSTYFIDAVEDSVIAQISKRDLDVLYIEVPKFERFFRIIIQNSLIAHQQRLTRSLSYSAERQYMDFVKRYPQLQQRLSQKQISSYLGITPVFLSMLRRKLAKK